MAKTWEEMMARERDALVAEKVMGLTLQRPPFVLRETDTTGYFTDEGAEVFARSWPSAPPMRRVPHYTTDIAAAWEVVEKMHADGNDDFVFELVHEGERPLFHLTAAEAAERICRAALRAKGVEV